MPTIIDSLLVRLGMDASDFDKKRKDVVKGMTAIKGSANEMRAQIKQASKESSQGFEEMAKGAAKFLAVIGGTVALKDFIEDTIASSAALQRFAQNIEKSISDVSAWGQAVEIFGGSADGLRGTMDMLSRAQTELMLTGQSSLIPYFSALGVNLRDAGGAASIFLHLADRFSHMDRQTANNMGRAMGIDQGTMNVLLRGRTETELMIKRLKETTAVTKAQGEEAEKLNEKMIATRQVFAALGRAIVFDAAPALEKIVQIFADLGDWLTSHKTLVEGALTAIAVALGAIGIALIPINLTVVAITALGAAMGLAYEDYKVWENGGKSLFNWAPAINLATAAFQGLRNILSDLLFKAAHVGAALMFLWDGDFKSAGQMIDVAFSDNRERYGRAPKTDRDKFIATAADKLGVPSNVIDAQLRLETGADGGKTVGAFNYGNIKAGSGYSGNVVSRDVLEFDKNGRSDTKPANFRSYSSVEDAANDYANVIAKRFPQAVGAQTAGGYARGLQAGGYATDPNYVRKLSNIATGIIGASANAGAAQDYSSQMRASPTTNNSSRSVSVGNVNVYTSSSDMGGIGSDFGSALDYHFVSQPNYGIK